MRHGDALAGRIVARGVTIPFRLSGVAATGQQRLGGSLSREDKGTPPIGLLPPRRRMKTKVAGLLSVRAGRRFSPGLGQNLVDLGPQRPKAFRSSSESA